MEKVFKKSMKYIPHWKLHILIIRGKTERNTPRPDDLFVSAVGIFGSEDDAAFGSSIVLPCSSVVMENADREPNCWLS